MTRRILLIALILILFIPQLQSALNLFNDRPLKGAIETIPEPKFSWDTWFNGTFQEAEEKYGNETFGLRNFFVRLNNEIHFRLFQKSFARDVIIGTNNYLYEKNYIKAYTGEDFISEDSIETYSTWLKNIQDSLKKRNIDLIIVFAPGKASFYPEFIPSPEITSTSHTNYISYSNKLKEKQVNFIDFNRWFVNLKTNSKYPLYPQYGIHWSVYGMTLATDSLAKYIEHIKKIDLPDLKIENVELSDSCRDTDNDLELGLNILTDLEKTQMAYPVLSFNEKEKIKPHVLTIADSYYWNIFGSGLASRLFEKPHFWYYFNQLYIAGEEGYLDFKEVDFIKEVIQQDVIIILCTEANLSRLGWGFIQKTHSILSENPYKTARLYQLMDAIRRTPQWFELVKQKSLERKLPLDSMIYLDALYVYQEELKNKK